MRRGLLAFILTAITAWSAFGQQAKMPEIWVAGRVYDVTGKPLAGATVEVMDLWSGELIGSEISDDGGNYIFRPKSDFKNIRMSFALNVWDGSQTLALSPQVVVRQNESEQKSWISIEPGGVNGWIKCDFGIPAQAGLKSASVPLDLHCVDLIDVTGTIRVEDGRPLLGAKGFYEIRYNHLYSRTGLGGELYDRHFEVEESATPAARLKFRVKDVHPTASAWWVVNASGAYSRFATQMIPSTTQPIDLVIPVEEFKEWKIVVRDEQGLPVRDAGFYIWYNDYSDYVTTHYGEGYSTDDTGTCVITKGGRQIYSITRLFAILCG